MAARGGPAFGAAAIGAATILLAGCVLSTQRPPSVSAGSSPEPSLTLPPGGVTPSIGASPQDVIPPAMAGEMHCLGLDVTVPSTIFRTPATAELGTDAAAAALRNHVHEAASVQTGWPATGWRLVGSSQTEAAFLARGSDSWWIATFVDDGATWMFSEGGNCDLQVDLPDGVGFASWRIDPATPPSPDDSALHLLGLELACASGKAPAARLMAPVVLPSDDAVTIALLVRGVPGGADCQGNPEFPITIDLGTPLGSRALFDGSTIPPSSRS